jgi:Lrp/AsnC family transcriptional regulator for asnA, asnC and gidA
MNISIEKVDAVAIPHGELDDIDKKIIEILKADGRMSFRKVAEKINKTEATVRRRVKRLEDDHLIDHFTVVMNDDADNINRAIINILPALDARKAIAKELMGVPEIVDVWMLGGKCGIFARVELKDMKSIQELIESKIANIKGIQSLETCMVLKELKSKK